MSNFCSFIQFLLIIVLIFVHLLFETTNNIDLTKFSFWQALKIGAQILQW